MNKEMETVPRPTAIEMRAPCTSLESRSLPSLSCPSQWDPDGPDNPESRSCAFGGKGDSHGAKIAARSTAATTKRPAAAPRWRRKRARRDGRIDPSSMADPRVETGIQKIRRQVDGDGAQGDEEDASLDERVVPGVDRLDQEPADP